MKKSGILCEVSQSYFCMSHKCSKYCQFLTTQNKFLIKKCQFPLFTFWFEAPVLLSVITCDVLLFWLSSEHTIQAVVTTRVGTLIVATIYLQLIQNTVKPA